MDDDADEGPGLARVGLDDGEERTLGRLAEALGIVGLIQIVVVGILLLFTIVGLFETFGHVLSAGATRMIAMVMSLTYLALPVWQGVMLREAGESIARVGGPDAEDQDFLASAFRRLRVVFVIELLLALWHVYDTLA